MTGWKTIRDKALGRSKPKASASPRDPEFPVLTGVQYISFLSAFHKQIQPRGYLEVGTQSGASLTCASCPSDAIDPEFKIKHDVIGSKPNLYMYQGTSDDFFASPYLESADLTLDFAFLDGMHLFEYLLRDFMNAERHVSAEGAYIAMHDCVPHSRVMVKRNWDKAETRSWTGDVWKILPVLKRFRPDLIVEVLDCPPISLVLVSNLDPGSRVLQENYDAIVDEYLPLDLPGYGVERFVDELSLVDSHTYFGGDTT